MQFLPDPALLKILQNEEKMEEYLQEFGDKPSSIDPIIWQVHLSAPAKKRMPVLNRFFQQLLKKYSLLFSFLPDHMVLAKVYKVLNIPFDINSKTMKVDLVSYKRPSKNARFNRYARLYNSWRKTEKNPDWGVYEYHEERSAGPFVSYVEFRKEYKNKKSYNVSAANLLSQLSKNKTKEKLVSNFTSNNTQFLIANSGQPIDCRISARDADQLAGKQKKSISKNPKCNLLKKQTLQKESGFKIFKSKYRPRLDVQVKTKHSDSASSAYPSAGCKRVSSGSYLKGPNFSELCTPPTSSKTKDETVLMNRMNIVNRSTSSGSPLKIPIFPKPCILSTFSKNEDETVLASRMDVENCPKSKEIETEADVTVENTAVEENLNNNKSTSINLNKFFGEDPNQLCSEESVSVIQPTPVDENSNSSEPEVVYSSNRSEDVSTVCSTPHPVLPNVMCHQLVLHDEERNSRESSGQLNEANSTQSPVREKSSQSHSSCEHFNSEQSKETSNRVVVGNFDQLCKSTPLKIEHKQDMMSLIEAKRSVDRLCEEYKNNHPGSGMWQTNGEEEKNEVSDSETSIVYSKTSPSPAYSVIYAQRSSESECEEINATNFSAVPALTVANRDEPIDYIPGQPASDFVCISQEKTCSQSRNSTPKQPASKVIFATRGNSTSPSKNSTPEQPGCIRNYYSKPKKVSLPVEKACEEKNQFP